MTYEYYYESRQCLKLLYSNGFARQDIRGPKFIVTPDGGYLVGLLLKGVSFHTTVVKLAIEGRDIGMYVFPGSRPVSAPL
jgi:hypothetical protein